MMIKFLIDGFELGISVFRIRDWGFKSLIPIPKNTNPQFKIICSSWSRLITLRFVTDGLTSLDH